jgi:DNA-binding transcriptional LysR family regulator
MESLSQIAAFVHAIQLGSFAAAGRTLGLSSSAIGKSVQRLEDRLGAQLLTRTTRKLRPTEAGREYYERCRRALDEIDEAERVLATNRDELRGHLRLDLPLVMGRDYVVPALAELLEAHPRLVIEVSLSDRTRDPVEGGADVVLRAGTVAQAGLVARKIGQQRLATYASPEFLSRCGTPEHPDDVLALRCVAFRLPSSGRIRALDFRIGRTNVALTPAVAMSSDDGEALVSAAAAGIGLVQVPSYMARHAVARGELVPILREFEPEPMALSAVYPQARHVTKTVRAVVALLVKLGKRAPWLV